MSTAWITHPSSKEHDNGAGHPERPARLDAIEKAIAAQPWSVKLKREEAKPASVADLERCHNKALVTMIRKLSEQGGGAIDGDTSVGEPSWNAALHAAGAAMGAVDCVLEGRNNNAFVAARPPGHHAESGRSMGFCLFNNVAIAARHAQAKQGVKRVAILDWDVHHGNGTQALVQETPEIRFVSMHQWPWYPGTGAADDRGPHRTVWNVPLPGGLPPDRYVSALEQAIDMATMKWTPDLVLVSAGFDSLAGDPLGAFTLGLDEITSLTRGLVTRTEQWCGGRVVSALEGGYAPDAVARAVVTHLRALA